MNHLCRDLLSISLGHLTPVSIPAQDSCGQMFPLVRAVRKHNIFPPVSSKNT
nr:MAG TPA: hypothetical protein [Bacteriophage sp.]DAY45659.1 MAG TPA: hypothetical protein [Caudoviricetes sp.]